jgi:hypothetical protein
MTTNEELNVISLGNESTYDYYKSIALECPYCGIIRPNGDKIPDQCKHIVFCYDWANGEYTDMSPRYRKILLQNLKNKEILKAMDETDRIEIENFLKSQDIPGPNIIRGIVNGLRYFEAYTAAGEEGVIWGHASEDLFHKI